MHRLGGDARPHGVDSGALGGDGGLVEPGLVVVDIAPEIATRGLARIYSNVTRSDRFDSVEEAVRRAREDNAVAPEDMIRDRVVNSMMRTEDGGWTYRYDRALRDPDVPQERLPADEGWSRVANIAVPALLVRGALSDILDREIAARFRAAAPDCQLGEVAGGARAGALGKAEEFPAAARA